MQKIRKGYSTHRDLGSRHSAFIIKRGIALQNTNGRLIRTGDYCRVMTSYFADFKLLISAVSSQIATHTRSLSRESEVPQQALTYLINRTTFTKSKTLSRLLWIMSLHQKKPRILQHRFALDGKSIIIWLFKINLIQR
jgi:hypothetical protein